jgi:hypothetical protein
MGSSRTSDIQSHSDWTPAASRGLIHTMPRQNRQHNDKSGGSGPPLSLAHSTCMFRAALLRQNLTDGTTIRERRVPPGFPTNLTVLQLCLITTFCYHFVFAPGGSKFTSSASDAAGSDWKVVRATCSKASKPSSPWKRDGGGGKSRGTCISITTAKTIRIFRCKTTESLHKP